MIFFLPRRGVSSGWQLRGQPLLLAYCRYLESVKRGAKLFHLEQQHAAASVAAAAEDVIYEPK